MTALDIKSATRFLFGTGQIAALGEAAAALGAQRALVVSDPGIEKVGHTQQGIASLENAGLETCTFDGLQENPTTEHVEAGLQVAKEFQPDVLIAIGGGSSMDCAKGVNFLYCCGGRMQDYWGVGKATTDLLPMIAVPTTAGTGSEAQSFALISDAETHVKMACGDKRAAFHTAVLDPALTVTQPSRVAALAGFDALSHAVETYVTTKRNQDSCRYSLEAWQRLAPNFLSVLRQPNDLVARGQMQLGACLAGLAIEHSMLGAAHALANPVTATFGVAHGEAVALMLPHVVRFNGRDCDEWYGELLASTSDQPNCPTIFRAGDDCGRDSQGTQDSQRTQGTAQRTTGPVATEPLLEGRPVGGADELADFLRQIASKAGLPAKLRECGVSQADIPQLADDAAKQWTARFNPVVVSSAELRSLYETAY